MIKAVITAVSVLTSAASAGQAQTRVHDEFTELNWEYWCPCRMDYSTPALDFGKDPDGTTFARIIVKHSDVGGNKCRETELKQCVEKRDEKRALPELLASFDAPESLGPSLRRFSPAQFRLGAMADPLGRQGASPSEADRKGGFYCTPAISNEGKAKAEETDQPCIQRQELTIQDNRWHPVAEAHRYSLRFRMPSQLQDETNSVRWVIAQWKQNAFSSTYGKSVEASPFLAVRFDDGILRVTVQDEHCRCVVAASKYTGSPKFGNGTPPVCESTKKGDPPHKECSSKLALEQFDSDPALSSPRGSWVTLGFRVQAGRGRGAYIDVFDGDKRKVRVTGPIGYLPSETEDTLTYFKFGHYRDYQPDPHKGRPLTAMDIDWMRIEPD